MKYHKTLRSHTEGRLRRRVSHETQEFYLPAVDTASWAHPFFSFATGKSSKNFWGIMSQVNSYVLGEGVSILCTQLVRQGVCMLYLESTPYLPPEILKCSINDTLMEQNRTVTILLKQWTLFQSLKQSNLLHEAGWLTCPWFAWDCPCFSSESPTSQEPPPSPSGPANWEVGHPNMRTIYLPLSRWLFSFGGLGIPSRI